MIVENIDVYIFQTSFILDICFMDESVKSLRIMEIRKLLIGAKGWLDYWNLELMQIFSIQFNPQNVTQIHENIDDPQLNLSWYYFKF